jgi:NADH-quinone oxidoreductase subunit F
MKVIIGQGSCGIASGAKKTEAEFRKQIKDKKIKAEVGITGCVGMCYLEPIVDVYGEPGTYPPSEASRRRRCPSRGGNGEPLLARLVRVQEKDAERIYKAAASGDLSGVKDLEISADDKEFLEKQTRIALRHCGLIDPEDIAKRADLDDETVEDVLRILKAEFED